MIRSKKDLLGKECIIFDKNVMDCEITGISETISAYKAFESHSIKVSIYHKPIRGTGSTHLRDAQDVYLTREDFAKGRSILELFKDFK